MKSRLGILALSAVLALGGCAARVKTVTDLPANVTQAQAQNYDAAVGKLHEIAAITSTLRQSVIALNKSGAFPDGPQYVTALTVVGKVDQFQLTAAHFLQGITPDKFDAGAKYKLQGYIQQISAGLVELNENGVTGIKNPQSLRDVNATIAELTAAVNFVLQLTQ